MANDAGTGADIASRVGLKLADKAFNFVPTWSEIGSALGIEGGLGAGVSGAASAFLPAGGFLALALALSQLAKPNDTSVLLGGGQGRNLDDTLENVSGPWADDARALYSQLLGDRKWIGSGDTSKVGDVDVGVGSMSMKDMLPYNAFEGLPYKTPDLAVQSMREIAQGRMGGEVDYDPIALDNAGIANALNNKSMELFDAPDQIDWHAWQQALDARNAAHGGGEGAVATDGPSYRDTLTPRAREFFDMGFTPSIGYQHTGGDVQPTRVGASDNTGTETDSSWLPSYSGLNGEADMNSPLARALASKGRGEDKLVAHIEPAEAAFLKMLGGSGTTNPKTGLLEFNNPELSLDEVLSNPLMGGGTPEQVDQAISDHAAQIDKSGQQAYDDYVKNPDNIAWVDPYEGRGVTFEELYDQNSGDPNDWSKNPEYIANHPGAEDRVEARAQDRAESGRDPLTGDDGWSGTVDWGQSLQTEADKMRMQTAPSATNPAAARLPTPTPVPAPQNYTATAPKKQYQTPKGPVSLSEAELIALDESRRTGTASTTDPLANLTWADRINFYNMFGYYPHTRIDNGFYQMEDMPEGVFGGTENRFIGNPGEPQNWDSYNELANYSLEELMALSKSLGLNDPYSAGMLDLFADYTHTFPVYAGTHNSGLGRPEGFLGAETYTHKTTPGFVAVNGGGGIAEIPVAQLIANPGLSAQVKQALESGQRDNLPGGAQYISLHPADLAARGVAGFEEYLQPAGGFDPSQIIFDDRLPEDYWTNPESPGYFRSPQPGMLNAQSTIDSTPEMIQIGPRKYWRHKDGTLVDDQGWVQAPVKLGDGSTGYIDTRFSSTGQQVIRNQNGIIVDMSGTPVITEFNQHIGPSSDPSHVYGTIRGAPAGDLPKNGEGGAQPWIDGRTLPRSNTPAPAPLPPNPGGVGGVGSGSGGVGGGGSGAGSGGGGGTDDDDDDETGGGNSRVLNAFPSGYELTAFGDTFDDATIERILSEETSKANSVLDRARASGQLNDQGFNAAFNELMGSARATSTSRLNDLSSEMLGGYRQDIRNIIADALDAESVGQNFSIDPYQNRINSLLSTVASNYYGNLLRQLGGPLFDTGALINAGGMAQSPISRPSNPPMF